MSTAINADKPSRVLVFAATAIVVCGLYFGREILIPIALTILFTFLLAPLVRRAQRWGLGRVFSVMLVMSAALLLVGAIFFVVIVQVADLLDKLPTYSTNLHAKFDPLIERASAMTTRAFKTAEELTQPASANGVVASTDGVASTQPVATAPAASHWMAGSLVSHAGLMLRPLATAGIVVVLVAFALLQRQDLRDRLLRLIGYGQVHIATEALDEAGNRVSRYLLMQTLINSAFGIVLATGLWLIGVPNALLWGLLAGVLRFIPYFGAWIGSMLPVLLSLGHFDGWTRPLMVIGFFILVELTINNVLEPWLYGGKTGMSPLAVLLAAVFWTWLWGAVGLLLAVPLTVCLVVLGKYAPQASFLHVMLGDQPVLEPHVRLYQRLLAMDNEDATDIVEERAKETSLLEAYEAVVLPALTQADQDYARGELDDRKHHYIHAAVRELIQELEDRFGPPVVEEIAAPPFLCVCVPTRNGTDELVAQMFCQVARLKGVPARSESLEELTARAAKPIGPEEPDVVIVSAVPPSSVSQARHVAKRLLKTLPKTSVIVGLWTTHANAQRVEERIGGGARVRVAQTFQRAIEALQAMKPNEEARAEETQAEALVLS